MNDNTKKIIIGLTVGLIILVMVASIISIIIYGYIYFFMPKKDVSYTYKVGTLKNVEDNDLKFVFNIRYYKNLDNSGVECFEIRNNSFIDEDQIDSDNPEVVGTGLQFVNPYFEIFSDTVNFNINDETAEKYKNWSVYRTFAYSPQYYSYLTFADNSTVVDKQEFISYSDYINKSKNGEKVSIEDVENLVTGLSANLELYQNKFLKISIGDDMFLLKFKNEFQVSREETTFFTWLGFKNSVYGFQQTFMNLCLNLYQNLQDNKECENQATLFELAEYLDFSIYDDESGTYKALTESQKEQRAKIEKYVNSYFAIKLDVYNYGLTKADESLFKCVKGLSTYNTDKNSGNTNDYFVGQAKIILTEKNFEFKLYEDESEFKGYYIALKNDVKGYYSTFKNIILDIQINMTELEKFNVTDFRVDKERLNIGDLTVFKFTKYKINSSGEREVLGVLDE